MKGWVGLGGWLRNEWDSLPVRRQSPISVLTGLDVGQLRWSRPTRYRYTKPPTVGAHGSSRDDINLQFLSYTLILCAWRCSALMSLFGKWVWFNVLTGHFVDESFRSVACIGTDKLTRLTLTWYLLDRWRAEKNRSLNAHILPVPVQTILEDVNWLTEHQQFLVWVCSNVGLLCCWRNTFWSPDC